MKRKNYHINILSQNVNENKRVATKHSWNAALAVIGKTVLSYSGANKVEDVSSKVVNEKDADGQYCRHYSTWMDDKGILHFVTMEREE